MGPASAGSPSSSSSGALVEELSVMAPRKMSIYDINLRAPEPAGTPEYSVKFYDTRKPSEQSLDLQESWRERPKTSPSRSLSINR